MQVLYTACKLHLRHSLLFTLPHFQYKGNEGCLFRAVLSSGLEVRERNPLFILMDGRSEMLHFNTFFIDFFFVCV